MSQKCISLRNAWNSPPVRHIVGKLPFHAQSEDIDLLAVSIHVDFANNILGESYHLLRMPTFGGTSWKLLLKSLLISLSTYSLSICSTRVYHGFFALSIFIKHLLNKTGMKFCESLNLSHEEMANFLVRIGYDLDEPLPDHSSLSRIRSRYGLDIFRRFFDAIVEQCRQAHLVWGKELYIDSTKGAMRMPRWIRSSLVLLTRHEKLFKRI